MDTLNKDDFTGELMQNSRLSVSNPDFETLIMQKIRKEETRKKRVHDILLYSSIFIAIDAVLFAMFKTMGLDIRNLVSQVTSVGEKVSRPFAAGNTAATIPQIAILLIITLTLFALIVKVARKEYEVFHRK
jgi:hypothetical protein